ncbi:proton-conducting transporter membrane subunit [uncultured Gimesia sp.]|uniref:proton-conducting transporter transmembrane domain-containing protein n=1 Tax=uncultured Gimesia sp. TaxID=1678688 RepID=UPI0030D7B351|tara:strand:- start:490 stop:1638 length:1149 start_codon:yes stop_codon:yes gene_type:complete
MFKDLYSLVISFELVCYLISMLTLCCIRVKQKQAETLLLLKSSLPLTLILFSGAVLLSASVGSSDLEFIHRTLERNSSSPGLVLNQSMPALGIVLIVAGAAFRMVMIPAQFRLGESLKELPYWLITASAVASVGAGALFLMLFINSIAVFNFSYSEQVLFFLALIVLSATAGLLLVETELKMVLVLLVLQITGVFFAQLSAVCWKWRHESLGADSISILDLMKESAPEYLFSYLAILGLACLLESIGGQRAEIRYPEQIQGLISDQRILGSAAVFLLVVLMGVPGLSAFQLKWQAMQALFEIHQATSAGTMAVVHAGYVGLSVLLVLSSAIVTFLCGKMIMQICFTKPLARYRDIPDKSMAFICYCCVIGLLIFNLGRFVSL